MSKIVLEVVLDESGSVVGLKRLEESLKNLGGSLEKVATQTARADDATKKHTATIEKHQGVVELVTKKLDGYAKEHEVLSAISTELSANGSSLGKTMMTVAAGIGVAYTAIMTIIPALKSMVNEYIEVEAAAVKMAATVKATGGNAGFSSERLIGMSMAMQNKTAFHEVEFQKAERVLMQFENIRGRVFAEALESVADVSVQSGKSIAAVSQLIGRALEVPEYAARGLRAMNIILSVSEREKIKAMVEHGQLMEAQIYLLDQIRSRTEGVATAWANETIEGKMQLLSTELFDLGQKMGEFITKTGNAHGMLGALTESVHGFNTTILGDKELMESWAKQWDIICHLIMGVPGFIRDVKDELAKLPIPGSGGSPGGAKIEDGTVGQWATLIAGGLFPSLWANPYDQMEAKVSLPPSMSVVPEHVSDDGKRLSPLGYAVDPELITAALDARTEETVKVNEATEKWLALGKQEEQQLERLFDRINPYTKALKDHNDAVSLLDHALQGKNVGEVQGVALGGKTLEENVERYKQGIAEAKRMYAETIAELDKKAAKPGEDALKLQLATEQKLMDLEVKRGNIATTVTAGYKATAAALQEYVAAHGDVAKAGEIEAASALKVQGVLDSQKKTFEENGKGINKWVSESIKDLTDRDLALAKFAERDLEYKHKFASAWEGDVVKGIGDQTMTLEGLNSMKKGLEAYAKMIDDQRIWDLSDRAATQLAQDLANATSRGLTDGIMTALSGGDSKEAAKKWTQSFVDIAAASLEKMINKMLKGGSLAEGAAEAGLWKPAVKDAQGNVTSQGGVNWGGVASTAGGLLMSYGQARQSPGTAAAGGFVSGLGMGMSAGMGWYSIIPAIVMAVVGYMSAGSKKVDVTADGGKYTDPATGYQYRRPYTFDVTGIDQAAEDVLANQWRDKIKTINTNFRDVFYALKEAVPDFATWFPQINDGSILESEMDNEMSDFSSWWRGMIEKRLPEELFVKVRPGFEAGLAKLGLSTGRIQELMGVFTEGNFDVATAELLAYIKVLGELRIAQADYGKSLADLREEAGRSPFEVWQSGLAKTNESLGRLLEDLPQLTSPEQVARAQQMLQLAEQQYQANLQMFAAIEAARVAAQERYESYTEAQERKTASAGGWGAEAEFLRRKFQAATLAIGNAVDSPLGNTPLTEVEARAAMDDAFRYAEAINALADAMEAALPQFDAIKESLLELEADLAVPIADAVSKLNRGLRQTFLEDSDDTLEKIAALKVGLDGLAPAEYLDHMQQIGQLGREQYERQLEYIRALGQAQAALNASIDAMLGSIKEKEIGKGGPGALGQYYVDEMERLWGELQGEQDPLKAKAIADKIMEFAQKLYGLDPDILINLNGVTGTVGPWLTGLLESMRALMNTRFEEAGAEAQGVADALLLALGGLTDGIEAQRTALEQEIENLRLLVETGLADTVINFDAVMTQFQATIVIANLELQEAITAMTNALLAAAFDINEVFGLPPIDSEPPITRPGDPPVDRPWKREIEDGMDDFTRQLRIGSEALGGGGGGGGGGAASGEGSGGLTGAANAASSALDLLSARLGSLSNLTITISVPEGVNAESSDPQLARIVYRNRGAA